MTKIAIFGLGEAGSLFAVDLVRNGMTVSGYDPAPVATPGNVVRCTDPQQAVQEADVIIAVTASADAVEALEQAFDEIPGNALYSDFSTSSAGLKKSLAKKAAERNLDFADIALMAVVPGNGIRTPTLASGTGAERFLKIFLPLGMPVESLGATAGDAATRKLLRSVFMKGLAAVMIEAMSAAEKVGLSEWLWDNLSNEISKADELLLHRLVTGTGLHAQRRLHEMEASEALLRELDVDSVMTRSTVASLRKVLDEGLPVIRFQESGFSKSG